MLDYLIKGGSLIDGTGSNASTMDLGIKDGKIVLNPKGEAAFTIDAHGKVVCPGFIDVHGHTDLFAFADPLCSAKLLQGITTEIGGQCGISPAPVRAEHLNEYEKYYKLQGAPIYPSASSLTGIAALMDTLDSLHLGINIALFAAHGSLRLAAMGLSTKPAERKELDVMEAMAREAMEAGALGLSTGLMYAPGSFTSKEELSDICKAIASYDPIYTSHIRNQGNGLEESVEEALYIAACAGISANISHHKAVGRSNWGKVRRTTEMIKSAGASHDVYPYTASSTTLSATLPPSYIRMDTETFLKGLKDSGFVTQLENSVIHPTEEWDNDLLECGYDGILIISSPQTPEALGCTISQYAEKIGAMPFDAYVKLMYASLCHRRMLIFWYQTLRVCLGQTLFMHMA